MKHLLDVNVLLAAIWSNHSRHAEAFTWLAGKEIVLCPISQLGFLRISTNKRAINAPMEEARELLGKFIQERKAGFVAEDFPALDSKADSSEAVTDQYLAELASRHSLKLATFDEEINHPAAVVVE